MKVHVIRPKHLLIFFIILNFYYWFEFLTLFLKTIGPVLPCWCELFSFIPLKFPFYMLGPKTPRSGDFESFTRPKQLLLLQRQPLFQQKLGCVFWSVLLILVPCSILSLFLFKYKVEIFTVLWYNLKIIKNWSFMSLILICIFGIS